jgi:hypothetical protein
MAVPRLDLIALQETALRGTPWDYVERFGTKVSHVTAFAISAVLALAVPALVGLSYVWALGQLERTTVAGQLAFLVVLLTSLGMAGLFGLLVTRFFATRRPIGSPIWAVPAFGTLLQRETGLVPAFFAPEKLVEATLNGLEAGVVMLYSSNGTALAFDDADASSALASVRASMRDPVRCAVEQARYSKILTMHDVKSAMFLACESQPDVVIDSARGIFVIDVKVREGFLKATVDATGIGQSVMTLHSLIRAQTQAADSAQWKGHAGDYSSKFEYPRKRSEEIALKFGRKRDRQER